MSTESYLKQLGVFGFEALEPIVLASLVTEDPLLLIGKCGTGKTFLLNSLSEALELEHRHYNASLISFDDLVGFPYPDQDNSAVKYLETPATIWGAQSVLVDEISRCKPEHQNRLFSLIQERRIQGLKLEHLRYRWAAMNPYRMDQGTADTYDGAEPLDQALADRFAFVIQVPDWNELDEETQSAIADPRGDGLISSGDGKLRGKVVEWRTTFLELLKDPPKQVIEYSRVAATVLGEAGIRISPRRVRQLARNLLASTSLKTAENEDTTFLLTLRWSLPHRAWGVTPSEEVILAAHRTAYESCSLVKEEKWLNDFHLQPSLHKKIEKLMNGCPNSDTGTLAVTQLLGNAKPELAAVFAFAVYPVALQGKLPIGAEGVNDLGRLATRVMDVDGVVEWTNSQQHPEFARLLPMLERLRQGARRERAAQLFNYLWVEGIKPEKPKALEEELNRCISILRQLAR